MWDDETYSIMDGFAAKYHTDNLPTIWKSEREALMELGYATCVRTQPVFVHALDTPSCARKENFASGWKGKYAKNRGSSKLGWARKPKRNGKKKILHSRRTYKSK